MNVLHYADVIRHLSAAADALRLAMNSAHVAHDPELFSELYREFQKLEALMQVVMRTGAGEGS